ncbi:hypothetical protein A6R71_12740 [Xanthomonas translucens pv. arrhenatheri]|uniref:Uncharacterized protein n=1 Tax=Xanthomonas graminis pv. arrhenatheri LMG 727 TaxID=1195923 RepID=A0A0K2ZHF0_9XANT|nr:hypothetical protein [Xanthomonas translucens]OAX63983.1 hypothetical protein A6R71_12740 [Xanthomonas translucens pv. arrhenatheri]UKE77497.1 hypothetical protein KM317_19170 [Xanthomonas translucens pv. arrhenatheri]CTP85068.1 hypothetical protein XTALMG727_1202 [Xanthomonas translucens pv. arrhenatheri LMG 727]
MRKSARLFFSTRPLGPLSIALLCIGLLCGFRPYPAAPASAAAVALRVIDRDADGADLPQYAQRGERWIAAEPGHRYALRLTNRSDRRVLVVLSVDGVNAVSGETASSDQRGYVLAPWQSTEIAGWRKSQREIAQFVFTDLADSYAARTGCPDNVGVIGMAVFDEAPTIVPQASVEQSRERADASMPAAAAMAAAPVQESDAAQGKLQRLGTGNGEREWSPSRVTEFERASDLPQQRLQLRYDSHARLVARGVIPRPRRYPRVADMPQAFPGDFVPDPPAY